LKEAKKVLKKRRSGEPGSITLENYGMKIPEA